MFRLILGLAGFIAGWLLGSRQVQQQHSPESAPLADKDRPALFGEEVRGLREVAGALRESVTALDKQLGRVGREQFKANTLGESQREQMQAALELLHELSERREADLELVREQLRGEQFAQRLNVIERLLPVLDGLDEAIAAGERLTARAPQAVTGAIAPGTQPSALSLTFQQRVAFVFGRGLLPTASPDGMNEWRQSLVAWLEGIKLVRERLLQVLAAEGVQPIAASGELFDPHRHVAVEAVPAAGGIVPGAVVEEYRRGYHVGERILRPSEVVVARMESAGE
jgi:molecular chaperone GrpE (heat shock protein)